MIQHIFQHMQIMPVEKCYVVTPQTPLKFLGQNLFGNQFWVDQRPESVPQAILGPRATPLSALYPLDLK